jgi:hypothetical protein
MNQQENVLGKFIIAMSSSHRKKGTHFNNPSLSLQAYIETKRDHADAGSSGRQLCMGEVEHPRGEK